ncbi:hypothetical protein CNECB9_5460044 [Cupriavidus necator]|uniref:Uncharacterized protein n=1 Tax=Cupriavidus necator TaxID=106590 RepID=A0A1K0IQK3_CUPNE|nr:hypothetical protein CNECB9_5460044 [Cupriavidus necator]
MHFIYLFCYLLIAVNFRPVWNFEDSPVHRHLQNSR